LWTGGVSRYQVELHWPADKEVPSPESIEVRVYPTSFGWFGWTVDRVLRHPRISSDRHTWVYQPGAAEKMDSAYSQRIDAATEMVAVFGDESAIPKIGVTGASVGNWKRMDVEIECGFQDSRRKAVLAELVEPYMAKVGAAAPLTGDRQGIVIPVLYAPGARPGLDSRLTIAAGDGKFTFSLHDLNAGPMLIPGKGVFITKSGSGSTARQFVAELEAKHLKSIRQMTREHGEAKSWDELMQHVRLWTCPAGTKVPPLPAVEDPPMVVQLPDQHWTDAWRAATAQLRGPHMWGGLAFEVGRVAHEMEMIGLQDKAAEVYEHFLSAPGAKSDGDYTDGNGALELATSMRHDMGYAHDGTHASTGRLLFAMSDRYFLTGDKAWFEKNRARLQAAADWIIRQRTQYMKDVPNRRELFAAGLMPPQMLGDYALPSCDWHWYYCDDAFSLQGVSRFADALREIDPPAGVTYREQADAFGKDLRAAATREAERSPVRLGRDGAYHSYIPRMAYARGLTGPELGAPQFPDCDMFMGALPLADPFGAMDANDPDMVDTLNTMEEMGTSPAAIEQAQAARKKKGLASDDAWFWIPYSRLPKASHNANIYLLEDDVPNFLRFWMNEYGAMVGSNGKFWEAWNLGNFNECTAYDNGTAGWFMENFRDLLVMEDHDALWLARATPRSWLEQGNTISVKNAPTYYGMTGYEIVSDVDHSVIRATLDIPSRRPAKSVVLRLRHPTSAAIKSVFVNGKRWNNFDARREFITLTGLAGTVDVRANY